MAPKLKKQNQFSCKKPVTSTIAWPNLPQQLTNIVAKQSSLMQNISFGGEMKSWRSTSKKCHHGKSQWPQLANNNIGNGDEYKDKTHSHNFDISFYQGCYWWYGREPPQFWLSQWAYYVGYSHGLLAVRMFNPSKCELRHPIEKYSMGLPTWDANIPFKQLNLSNSYSYPSSPCTVMVLTGTSCPAFMFCRIQMGGEYKWAKQEGTIIDPHGTSQALMQFSSAIGVKGKFYALSLQGTLAVIEYIDSQLKVTALSKSRAVPSVLSKHFREYLVESNDEILLVFLISGKTVNIVDDVEVFRLHFDRLTWVKMERLGDRALFVGDNSCMWVNASEVGCKRNCVYFSHYRVDGWWFYDMESGGVLPGWRGSDFTTKSVLWDEEMG